MLLLPQHQGRRQRRRVPTAAWSSSGSSGDGSSDQHQQERAITLHTLELPLLEDPGEYQSVLQARFPGATLLRWHLSEVVKKDGGEKVALAEVVVVESKGAAGQGNGGGEKA